MRSILTFLLLILLFATTTKTAIGAEWLKKSPDSQYLTTVETTPYGVFAGENDFTPWLGRFDGVYKSKDFGESWTRSGLEGRGVTDIAFDNDIVYTTTQFAKNSTIGLFKSHDAGLTWQHYPQVNFGGLAITVHDGTILFGTVSNGLWASFDNGETWTQKIGTGFYGPKIHELKFNEKITLASSDNKTYKSTDGGKNWQEVNALTNQRIRYIEISDNTILAGVENTEGMFKSTDLGNTWKKVTNWGNSSTGAISYFQGTFYAGKTNMQEYRSVFSSNDSGNIWQDTGLMSEGNYANIKDLAWLYSEPSYIFAVTHNDGIYRLEIPSKIPESFPFLGIPWDYNSESELLDKVTAYFDHRYPLLGYRYFSEPTEFSKTTMNFMGIESGEPTQYYSSHNGIDFELEYGTPVIAPASGYATYHYCDKCGHSIKIDHLNGYESTFMHLQGAGLVNTEQVPVLVGTGDVIGKVGMTGNTTGPHLHINITKDLNNNGHINSFPSGLVDPFGWQNSNLEDPWTNYDWQDTLGTHTGTTSKYLWDVGVPKAQQVIKSGNSGTVENQNKSLFFPEGALVVDAVVEIYNYARPKIDETFLAGPALKYIENSSFLIKLINFLGKPIKQTYEPVVLSIDFSAIEMEGVILPSLKIYHFNEETQQWEPLETLLLDLENKKITAATSMFSRFALFGEIEDSVLPSTTILIEGEKDNQGWYTTAPTISFTGTGTIYYKIGNDIDWIEYKEPIEITREGVFGIDYKAVNENGMWETTKESALLKVSNGKYVDTVMVVESELQISDL